MPKANTWNSGLLNLIFINTTFQRADATDFIRGAATAGSVFLSLHTADPGTTGNQSTSETAYTGYTRLTLARDGTTWTVSGTPPQAKNNNQTNWPTCTASPGGNLTHLGIGTDLTGAGKLLYSGTITTPVVMAIGVTPILGANALVVQES